jgi:hypothetical protein
VDNFDLAWFLIYIKSMNSSLYKELSTIFFISIEKHIIGA